MHSGAHVIGTDNEGYMENVGWYTEKVQSEPEATKSFYVFFSVEQPWNYKVVSYTPYSVTILDLRNGR